MRRNSPKQGKQSAIINFFVLTAIIVGLSVYFTVYSHWNVGTAAVIVILLFPAGLYLWIWRKYFK